jgi:hypothetical protein
MNRESELQLRWSYLQEGAEVGTTLVRIACERTMPDLDIAVHRLSRKQLEAACSALVLAEAQHAALVDP